MHRSPPWACCSVAQVALGISRGFVGWRATASLLRPFPICFIAGLVQNPAVKWQAFRDVVALLPFLAADDWKRLVPARNAMFGIVQAKFAGEYSTQETMGYGRRFLMEGNTYLVHKPAVNAPGKSTSCAAPCSTSSAAQFTRHTNHCPQRGSLSIKDGVGKIMCSGYQPLRLYCSQGVQVLKSLLHEQCWKFGETLANLLVRNPFADARSLFLPGVIIMTRVCCDESVLQCWEAKVGLVQTSF
eukprot:1148700-Pelagomonas_calceolata.AAC.7